MKATKKTKSAADFVDVRKNDKGHTIYTCLKCGMTRESNTYYEPDYKAMLEHAAECDGQGIPPGPKITEAQAQSRDVQLYGGGRALQPQPRNLEALNRYIVDLAGHIKKCIPNGDDLTNDEAIGLARISMVTDLSPFTGEVWYISKKGPHIGIRGLRRKAKEQSLYSKYFRAMTPEEIKEHDVRTNAGDVGCICELFRHDLTKEAAEINKLAGEPVIPIKPIIGVGIWRKKYPEIAQYKDDPVPHGKSPAWVAKKRAEADALGQAYDIGINLPHADEPSGYLEVADVEDADWSVVPEPEIIRREAAINGERMAQVSAAPPQDFSDIVAKYQSGELEIPPWVEELRDEIRAHPKASDALGSGNGMVQQLKLSAERTVKTEQFRVTVEIICQHPLEDVTFGEAAVLMNSLVNGHDFEAKVVALLS